MDHPSPPGGTLVGTFSWGHLFLPTTRKERSSVNFKEHSWEDRQIHPHPPHSICVHLDTAADSRRLSAFEQPPPKGKWLPVIPNKSRLDIILRHPSAVLDPQGSRGGAGAALPQHGAPRAVPRARPQPHSRRRRLPELRRGEGDNSPWPAPRPWERDNFFLPQYLPESV
eukprot:gene23159-biopygen17789